MEQIKGTVLYVGGFEMPDKNAAAHRVLNNAKILRELGYRVVFCGIDKEIKPGTVNTTDVCGFESTPMPYPTSSKQWIKNLFDISLYMQVLKKYSDIKMIICYNPYAVPLLKLLSFGKKHNIKVIVDCTEWHGDKKPKNLLQLIKFTDFFLCMHWLQKKCNGMIAISSYLENYYKKSIKNIIVVPPLVDLNDEKFKNDSLYAKNSMTTLVYSGSPVATKESLGDVITALNNLSDLSFKFKIVGIDHKQFCEKYFECPLNEKIEFMGRVPHKVALRAVKDSDYAVIVRPKSKLTMAGFPTKFAEAISCGTAVIANATSDLPKYIKDNKNGYLVDENNLEHDLRKILSSTEKPYVQKELFDYRAWKDVFEKFLQQL